MKRSLLTFLFFGLIAGLLAQDFTGCLSLDFESLPTQTPREGLIISDQFLADFGISFSLENGTSPRLAEIGAPTTAFASTFGQDMPAPGSDIGRFFLTDDGSLSGLEMSPLIITFAQPVDSFSTCVLDIDLGEWFVIEAFGENGELLLEDVIRDGDAGTGDGVSTCWGFNFDGCQGSVYSVRFAGFRQTPGAFGLGMDNFSFCFTGVDLANALAIETTDLSCTEPSGTISMVPLSGNSLEYSLDGITYQPEPEFPNLPVGNYSVFVRDANGCTAAFDNVLINDIVPLVIEDVLVEDTRCGEANGQLEIVASPVEGLFYSINEAPFTMENSFASLPAGNYEITIIDTYECFYTAQASIAASSAPELTSIASVPDYCGTGEGSGIVTASGGSPPLSFSLADGTTSPNGQFSNLLPGAYELTVVDAAGCRADSILQVAAGELMNLEGITTIPPICTEQDGEITLQINGGNGPLIYELEGLVVQTDSIFSGLGPGSYAIRVRDALGCSLEASASLPLPRCPLYVPNVFSPNDDSLHDDFRFYTASFYELDVVRYEIFDRWGELVWRRENFTHKNFREWWDGSFRGRLATQGVYVYLIEVLHPNGEVEVLSGDVTLIR